jgi:hypothetical protein
MIAYPGLTSLGTFFGEDFFFSFSSGFVGFNLGLSSFFLTFEASTSSLCLFLIFYRRSSLFLFSSDLCSGLFEIEGLS